MDSLDLKILSCLKNNARAKASQISEEVNLSVSAVTERIKKLEAVSYTHLGGEIIPKVNTISADTHRCFPLFSAGFAGLPRSKCSAR